MRASLSLELGCSLLLIPTINRELSNIHVHFFGQKRTGRDRAVGPVGCLVFLVTLVQDTGVDGVQLINAGKVDVANDGVEKWKCSLPTVPAFQPIAQANNCKT